MPTQENNGRVTNAILATKIDMLMEQVKRLDERNGRDHDDLVWVKGQLEEIVHLKRAFIVNIFGILAGIGIAVYALIQSV